MSDPTINRDVLRLAIYAIGGTIPLLQNIRDGGAPSDAALNMALEALTRAVTELGYVCPVVNAEVMARFESHKH